MVEVTSTIVLMFWVNLEKYGLRYSHCTSDSVYTDLSLNTPCEQELQFQLHCVFIGVLDTLLLNKSYKEMLCNILVSSVSNCRCLKS